MGFDMASKTGIHLAKVETKKSAVAPEREVQIRHRGDKAASFNQVSIALK